MSFNEPPRDPAMPQDSEGPVFAEPWQAQAFALAVKLHDAGAFSWTEWAEALGAERAADPDDGSRYYDHWVAALEKLMSTRGVGAAALAARAAAWADAYRRTPHGKPVEL